MDDTESKLNVYNLVSENFTGQDRSTPPLCVVPPVSNIVNLSLGKNV